MSQKTTSLLAIQPDNYQNGLASPLLAYACNMLFQAITSKLVHQIPSGHRENFQTACIQVNWFIIVNVRVGVVPGLDSKGMECTLKEKFSSWGQALGAKWRRGGLARQNWPGFGWRGGWSFVGFGFVCGLSRGCCRWTWVGWGGKWGTSQKMEVVVVVIGGWGTRRSSATLHPLLPLTAQHRNEQALIISPSPSICQTPATLCLGECIGSLDTRISLRERRWWWRGSTWRWLWFKNHTNQVWLIMKYSNEKLQDVIWKILILGHGILIDLTSDS